MPQPTRTASAAGGPRRPLCEPAPAIARWALRLTIALFAACARYHDPVAPSESLPNVGGVAAPNLVPSVPSIVGVAGAAAPVRMPPMVSARSGSGGSTAVGSGGRSSMGSGGTPGSGTGGTASMDAGAIDPPWQAITCLGQPPTLLSSVTFTMPVDYVAIYASFPAGQADSDAGAPAAAFASSLSETGQACRNATDASACRATLDLLKAPSDACKTSGVCSTFLLLTVGDQVSRIDARANVVALLGPIDTPAKAAAIALYDGDPISCDNGFSGAPEGRPWGDGYEVRNQYQICPNGRWLEILAVSKNGAAFVVSRFPISGSTCLTGN